MNPDGRNKLRIVILLASSLTAFPAISAPASSSGKQIKPSLVVKTDNLPLPNAKRIELVNRAAREEGRKDYVKAAKTWTEIMSLDPTNISLHSNRAQVYRVARDYKKAIEDYLVAVRFEPCRQEDLDDLAFCYQSVGDFKQAFAFNERVLKLDACYGPALRNRAALLEKLGKHSESLECISKMKAYGYTEDAHRVLSQAAWLQRDHPLDAIHLLKVNASSNPRCADIFLQMAMIEDGQPTKSDESILSASMQCVKHSPEGSRTNRRGLLHAARALAGQGKIAQAMEYCNRALKGVTFDRRNRNFNTTVDVVEEALKSRAQIYALQSKAREAISDLSMSIELFPKHGYTYRLRGDLYEGIKDYDKALSDWNTCIAESYFDTAHLLHRVQLLKKMSRFDDAVKQLDYLISLSPRDELLYSDRALCHERLGQFAKAIDDYTSAIKNNDEVPAMYLSRAKLYRKLNKPDLAAADEKHAAQMKDSSIF